MENLRKRAIEYRRQMDLRRNRIENQRTKHLKTLVRVSIKSSDPDSIEPVVRKLWLEDHGFVIHYDREVPTNLDKVVIFDLGFIEDNQDQLCDFFFFTDEHKDIAMLFKMTFAN